MSKPEVYERQIEAVAEHLYHFVLPLSTRGKKWDELSYHQQYAVKMVAKNVLRIVDEQV